MKRFLILTTTALALGATAGLYAQTEMPAAQAPQFDQQGPPFDPNEEMQQPPEQRPMNQPPNGYPVAPPRLTIPSGTYVNVRINQWLSSDRNQQGDAFFGSLASPIVVNGVVVGQRGQTVSGRVSEAVKAGHVQGTSRLGLQLTELTLVDGQQVPVDAEMISREGSTSIGRDATAIGATTGVGAIIGAGVNDGKGAAIGAGAGAAAGILGVLLTRGNPTVVYPETVLTFRLDRAVDVDTSRSSQAFRYADARDYGQPRQAPPSYGSYNNAPPSYGTYNNAPPSYGTYNNAPPPPPPAYYGPGYYPSYYGYGYGPGFSVYVSPGYYRGYYRGYYFRGGRRW